jgi:hypothetical protein
MSNRPSQPSSELTEGYIVNSEENTESEAKNLVNYGRTGEKMSSTALVYLASNRYLYLL